MYRPPNKSFVLRRIGNKLPVISYWDRGISFFNGYSILSFLMMVFGAAIATISLLILVQAIPINENIRHGIALGFAAFGLLISVPYVSLAFAFYHDHASLSHRYKVETVSTLAGTFFFFWTFFAMLLVVDNRYGKNGIVADDDLVDDIHFDDDSNDHWSNDKRQGKVIEGVVLMYGVLLGIFVIYWGIRSTISHMYAEVTNQADDYIRKTKAELFHTIPAKIRGVPPAPVGLNSFNAIKQP